MAQQTHVEEENSDKDETPPKKIRSTVLDTFRKLTHNQEKIRVKSGLLLLKHLSENKTTENGVTELKYALGRLIRGLGSSKNSAKSGFYSVLVALLSTFEDISVADVFDYVKKELHSSGSNSKSENADISSGQILVCGAIIRTGLFQKTTHDERKEILEQLFAAGKKRNYLYLAAVSFVINLCEKIDEGQFKPLWDVVRPEFDKPWSEQTIDSLYLFYVLRTKFPNVISRKFVESTLGTDEILCKANLHPLANILMNIPSITFVNHPIYSLICKDVAEAKLPVPFLNEIDSLMPRLNYNRHLVVTNVLINLLGNLIEPKTIPDLLTKNYTQQTLQYFKMVKSSKDTEELQAKVYALFNAILEALKCDGVDSDVKIGVLKKLIFYPGIFIFEKITRSKIVQQITATLDENGVKMLGKLYVDVIFGTSDNKDDMRQPWLNNDKIYAAQLLVKLLGHPAMQNDMEWKTEQLKCLLDLSLIKYGDVNIGVDLAASLRETFFRSLGLKLPKLEDLRSLLSKLVHHLDEYLTIDEQPQLRHPLNEEALSQWRKTIELINKLEKKMKKSHLNPVFHTLFLHMALQLFNNVKLSGESLQELHSCYTIIKKEKKNRNESKSDDEPLWIEVVVDLFLNLLSHNSLLLRNLIGCVFPHLCKDLNATAIHQILDVLDPKNEDNPLGSSVESDSEGSNDEGSNDEGSNDEVSNDEASDEENETVSDKLRLAVQTALHTIGHQSDDESVDIDNMSESEGAKLDEALSEAFKQHKPATKKKSNKQSKEDEALTHFRIRVLDLIDCYLDSTPSTLLCLEIMLPLLRLLEFSIRDAHQKPLCDRVRSCLKKLTNLKKLDVDEVNESILIELFESLLEKGTKSNLMMQEMGDKIADCCVFVVRCSQLLANSEAVDKKSKKKLKKAVANVAIGALHSYFTKRDCVVLSVLLKTLLQLNWDGGVKLATPLLQYAFDDAIKPFRRAQALDLLKIFYGNHRLLSINSESFATKLQEHETKLSVDVINLFANFENHNPRVKEKYVCSLFNLLSAIKQSPLKNETINWGTIGECVREYRSGVTLVKDTKVAYNKLCRVLGVPNLVKMKPVVIKTGSDENGETENGETESVISSAKDKKERKRSKAMNAEKRKLKKQTQQIRMQDMSEGLASSLFSKTHLQDMESEELNGVEAMDEESDGSSRKRKNGSVNVKDGKKLKIKESPK